ncbi:hypothetical protein NUW54_g3844 [Trametes sanguinea]|uniref:Uncharacterized protein n=1 Tax=Trametes sanguinea TaxID=158606 RepID=A0ACC1PZR9_9APHY|nr:hypothetical protein NUW54_g3844 [Trametes sanguinea]
MASTKKAAVSDPSSSKQASSTSHKKPKRPQHKKHPSVSPASVSNALPGVQKIKAAIRQTRRLLAKDNLAADVRVTTERRLKSLEAEPCSVGTTTGARPMLALVIERGVQPGEASWDMSLGSQKIAEW